MSFESEQIKQYKLLDKNTTAAEKAAVRNYKKAITEIRAEISIIYEKYAVNGKLTLAEMTKFNRLTKLEKEITRIMNDLYNTQVRQIKRAVPLQFQQAYYRFSYTVDQEIGIELNWGLLEIESVQAAIDNPLSKISIESLKKFGKLDIKRALSQGIIQGQSIGQMAKEITKGVKKNLNKALRIIRTEMHRAEEAGHHNEYLKSQDLGVDSRMKLLSVLDDRTRPQSAQMDGDISNKEGKFKYPNGSWYVVGSIDMPGKYSINDRERSIQIIKDISPQLRRTKEDGIIPFKTYETWAKEKGITKNKYGQILFPEDK